MTSTYWRKKELPTLLPPPPPTHTNSVSFTMYSNKQLHVWKGNNCMWIKVKVTKESKMKDKSNHGITKSWDMYLVTVYLDFCEFTFRSLYWKDEKKTFGENRYTIFRYNVHKYHNYNTVLGEEDKLFKM